MLDAEELMLRVGASVGAIREARDELEAREVGLVILHELIDEGTLDVCSRQRENGLILLRSLVNVAMG